MIGHLTAQERRIVGFLKDGLSAKQIAQELGISWRTVESHRENIRKKFGVRSSIELVCLLFKGEGANK